MQRKPTRQSRGADSAERRHIKWIKERCICAACGCNALVVAHHCEGACFKINKVQLGHIFVVGLCITCDNIVTRGSRKALREAFGPQSEMWRRQLEQYPLKHEFGESEIQAIIDYGR
jgi:hypothetical protein